MLSLTGTCSWLAAYPHAMSSAADFWFPGRWLGGVSLVIAPLCMLAGVILRIQFHFFFPQQLAAFADHPSLIAVSYNLFLIGNILLWPAIVTLARMIGLRRSGWGVAGGALVMFGLFTRACHGGADHLAFQLVRLHGVERARRQPSPVPTVPLTWCLR